MKKLKFITNSANGYYVFAELPIDDVLVHLGRVDSVVDKKRRAEFAIDGKVYTPKVSSVRLQTFKQHGTSCHYCGRVATKFKLEQTAYTGDNPTPHLNMYADDVMMTYDHVVPKCIGGADNTSNTVTSCYWCNNAKASSSYDDFKKAMLDVGDVDVYRLTFVDKTRQHTFTHKLLKSGDVFDGYIIESVEDLKELL